jgi:uncharacterized small protein (DUF1192 family)
VPTSRSAIIGGYVMGDESSLSLPELDDRIAILRDNIRQLVEQAAGASGERNEERVAERLSVQNEELEKLIKERDSKSK